MLVKHLSTVAKNLANAVSFVAVFFVRGLLRPWDSSTQAVVFHRVSIENHTKPRNPLG